MSDFPFGVSGLGAWSFWSIRLITSVGCRLVSALQCANVKKYIPGLLFALFSTKYFPFSIPQLVHRADLKCIGTNQIEGSIINLGLRRFKTLLRLYICRTCLLKWFRRTQSPDWRRAPVCPLVGTAGHSRPFPRPVCTP